jgi:hypothetical protein
VNRIKAAVVTAAAVASLVVTVAPAQAAESCKSGGQTYMCEYGITTKKLPDGTKQVFAVGLDREVHTRWTDSDGDWSDWESMGGVAMSAVALTQSRYDPWVFSIHVIGTDGFGWFRERGENGYWSDWARNRDPQ